MNVYAKDCQATLKQLQPLYDCPEYSSEASTLPRVTDSAQSSATGMTSGSCKRLGQHQQAIACSAVGEVGILHLVTDELQPLCLLTPRLCLLPTPVGCDYAYAHCLSTLVLLVLSDLMLARLLASVC